MSYNFICILVLQTSQCLHQHDNSSTQTIKPQIAVSMLQKEGRKEGKGRKSQHLVLYAHPKEMKEKRRQERREREKAKKEREREPRAQQQIKKRREENSKQQKTKHTPVKVCHAARHVDNKRQSLWKTLDKT